MSTVNTPHFNFPFTLTSAGAQVVEQDSEDDITNCVRAILSTPKGWRDEVPEFGIDPPTFSLQPLGAEEIAAEVMMQEPRADLVATEHPGYLDELVADLNIMVSPIKESEA
jgi:phage baseplate assembly protein W